MSGLLLLAVLAQSPADTFEGTGAYEVLDERGGLTLSRRPMRASPYSEYRVEAATPYPLEDLCHLLYEWGTREADSPGLTASTLLRDGGDERVIYNQFSQPLIANRDYALVVRRERLPDGRCRVRFRTANELAPPKPEGWVRMERLWGEWLMAPRQGGTQLTYTLFSDPGGSIPAFLVHGAARDAARATVRRGLERAGRALEARRAAEARP